MPLPPPAPVPLAPLSLPIPDVVGAGNRETGRGKADATPIAPYLAGARSPLTVDAFATGSTTAGATTEAGAAIGTLLGPVEFVGATTTLPFGAEAVVACLSVISTRRGPVPSLLGAG